MSNNNESSECRCIAGYYLNGSTCKPCEPGYYCNNSIKSECGAGYYCGGFVNGNAERISCPNGRTLNNLRTAKTKSECLTCGDGSKDNPLNSVPNLLNSACVCSSPNNLRSFTDRGKTTYYCKDNISGDQRLPKK
jgi:hypothetical protein